MDIQRNLETNVEKRSKDAYGPPMGKRLIIFLDDLNMPRVSCCWLVGYFRNIWGGADVIPSNTDPTVQKE